MQIGEGGNGKSLFCVSISEKQAANDPDRGVDEGQTVISCGIMKMVTVAGFGGHGQQIPCSFG